MKNITKLILSALLLLVLSITGCSQTGTSSGAENQGTNPAVPQNPDELVEADVLTAFGLQRGKITASAAAKKIATGHPASGITFTSRAVVSYDDQTGSFTVRIIGNKNGKPFNKALTLTGFTHPLAGKMIKSVDKCELNLDEGIENNYSLAKYIDEVNKDPSGAKLVKKLSFLLNDGTTIELGEHDTYTLTAKAVKTTVSNKEKVKIRQVFKVAYRKKVADSTSESIIEKEDTTAYNFPDLIKDYFTEKEVFQYILDKTSGYAIKADSNQFASSFYAFAKKPEVHRMTLLLPSLKQKFKTTTTFITLRKSRMNIFSLILNTVFLSRKTEALKPTIIRGLLR